MKTNKEIKPFKMRCENREEFRDVVSILDINGVDCNGLINGDDLIINVYRRLNSISYITLERHFNEPEPELTYSEFMKLYGEEEEVFTREDMDLAMNWAIKTYAVATDWTKPDKYELLTKYLSERTND